MSDPVGFLLVENFEAAPGYDVAGWSEIISADGTVDEDDTTVSILRETQQLKVYGGSAAANYASTRSVVFAATAEIWAHFLMRLSTALPAGLVNIFSFNDGTSIRLVVSVNANGTIKVTCGTASATTVSAIAADTDYRFWVYYKQGTGADALYSVEFTPKATTAPIGSGNAYAGGNDGSRTNTMTTAQVGVGVGNDSGRTRTIFFDQVYVDNAAIGDVAGYDAGGVSIPVMMYHYMNH